MEPVSLDWHKIILILDFEEITDKMKTLPDGELNPGLPRDRRGYSPLYYRGRLTEHLSKPKICSHSSRISKRLLIG